MTKTLATAAALLLGLASLPATAAQTYPTRDFFMNKWGGVNQCVRSAATDGEVAWCAGDLPPTSKYNPARFDCRQAEVDSEYLYCHKPFPKRHR